MTAEKCNWIDDDIILYDGACVLCSAWVRFVVTRDVKRQFRFTPIESEYGRRMAAALNIEADDPDTNAVITSGRVYFRSDAAIEVLSVLPYWKWVWVLRICPRPIRDLVYNAIAQNRYRWFGRNDVCDIGSVDFSDRVILTYKID